MLKPKTIVAAFEALWEVEPGTVKQISAKSGLSDVTVRRCLETLCERGEAFEIAGIGAVGNGTTPCLYMTTKTESARKAAAYRVACQRRDAAAAAQGSVAQGAAA